MSYVPDDSVLGNPGLFGFIGKAVKSVVGVVSGVVSGVSKGGSVSVAPPQIIVQSPAPTIGLPSGVPSWVIPAGIGAVALLVLVPMLSRGGRR